MRTTLRDIAQQVGVSTTTVSLVINNKPCRISDEVRASILKVASELDYRPNRTAVNLVTKNSNLIGVIVPSVSNIFFGTITSEIEAYCYQNGYAVLIGNTYDMLQRDIHYLKTFVDLDVSGIIFTKAESADPVHDAQCADILQSAGIPTVLLLRHIANIASPSIYIDHFLAGYLGTQHLLSLGHKRIGCITGACSLQGTKFKTKGYRCALAEGGIGFDPALIVEGDYSLAIGEELTPYFLTQDCSAIFTYNDMMALGVYKALRQLKYRVPEDISLLGCDDIYLGEVLEKPLSTVSLPLEKLGQTAGHIMIDLLTNNNHIPNQNETPSSIVLEPALRVRQTTACRRA